MAPTQPFSPLSSVGLEKCIHDISSSLAALVELNKARKLGLALYQFLLAEGGSNPCVVFFGGHIRAVRHPSEIRVAAPVHRRITHRIILVKENPISGVLRAVLQEVVDSSLPKVQVLNHLVHLLLRVGIDGAKD